MANAQNYKVMTYNIRLDIAIDGEDRWDNRKGMLAGQLQFYEPDFLGVQEALPQQMQYLDSILIDHSFIGVGRDDGKEKGEYSAIFYKNKKFKVLQQSTFWLSQTPEVPSKGWDAAYNRVCSYGLFENRDTKQKVWIFNTHFDHVGNVARVESAKLILQKIKELNKENLPFIVMGDFNLEPDTDPIAVIKTELLDTRDVSKFVFGPTGTFNAFEFHKPVTKRIDYIFIPKTGFEVKKYAILSDSKDCHYPSDHLPVYVELSVKK
jgi:endonuclease/exonuclease/phosphatase family metal-dependent hydrolase